MAEGFARHVGGDLVEVHSAGVDPAGFVHPMAIEVMKEGGIDIGDQYSKMLDAALLKKMDVVVTVCGHAREMCPVIPVGVRHEHWPISDPVVAAGDREIVRQRYREIRDDIEKRVKELLKSAGIPKRA